MGRITVDTDVVRENNQTYRLGYTEMCKDGSKMGIGCPEYVLLFRKLPSDTSRAYADLPVTKNKSEYSLARWQIDAHASWKSSGNSLLSYEDMKGAGIDKIRHLFRNYERGHVYDYEEHVSFAEELEAYGKLPKTFMAVDPVSKKPWIWDDVTRMRTLNTKQSQKKRQNHICPLQLDIVERLIERYSNRGELVFDPFGGIGTVPYCAINLGRKGLSTELNYDYWKDSLSYLYEAEMEVSAPTLFDLMNDAVIAAEEEQKIQEAAAAALVSKGQSVVDYAYQFLGNPYVWGGTSLTNGADCSGFVQSVYAHFGISLPRTSYEQRTAGDEISYAEAQPGDLILYEGHVGIYMGDGKIINAMNEAQGIGVCSATYTNIVAVRRVL